MSTYILRRIYIIRIKEELGRYYEPVIYQIKYNSLTTVPPPFPTSSNGGVCSQPYKTIEKGGGTRTFASLPSTGTSSDSLGRILNFSRR